MKHRAGDESAGFEITTDVMARRLYMRSWGYFDRPLAERCRAALEASHAEMRKGGPWNALCDNKTMLAQKAEVQELISETMEGASLAGLRRIAFVLGSAVAKLQMRRLATGKQLAQVAFFESREEAERWLEEG
jgi:hypothetical protein